MKINSLKNAAMAASAAGFVMLMAGAPVTAQALDLGVGGKSSIGTGTLRSGNTVRGETNSVLNLGTRATSDVNADVNSTVDTNVNANVDADVDADADVHANTRAAAQEAARAKHRAVISERRVRNNLDSDIRASESVNTDIDADIRGSARVNE